MPGRFSKYKRHVKDTLVSQYKWERQEANDWVDSNVVLIDSMYLRHYPPYEVAVLIASEDFNVR